MTHWNFTYEEHRALSLCACGSRLQKRDLVDARGIFCGYVCDRCEKTARARFRPEVFANGDYTTDEPIDDGDGSDPADTRP